MEGNEIGKKLRDIMSDILEVSPDEIADKFGPDDAAQWDSMNNLRMVSAIEEEFGIKLTMKEIGGMTDFGKVRDAVSGHLR